MEIRKTGFWSEHKQNIIISFDKNSCSTLMGNLNQADLAEKEIYLLKLMENLATSVLASGTAGSRKSILCVCISWLCFPLY